MFSTCNAVCHTFKSIEIAALSAHILRTMEQTPGLYTIPWTIIRANTGLTRPRHYCGTGAPALSYEQSSDDCVSQFCASRPIRVHCGRLRHQERMDTDGGHVWTVFILSCDGQST